ncbi:MAG: Bax inhibitor-1 family protein [Planctomycetes bacterium]|nr:Bax inhibitor-1 family protein [Planctomycetota bacterium]
MTFIKRTYGLLLIAILGFVGLEAILLNSGIGLAFFKAIAHSAPLLIGTIVLFIASGFIASTIARSNTPPLVQALGLALYVVVEAFFLLPFMYLCTTIPQFQHIPLQAGILTLTVFGGLSAVVFISKKDFSFLGKILMIASFTMLGIAIVAMLGAPINLGLWFSAAMIAIACGYILYDTSNVLHHYPTTAYVAASLELFASVALLFYYIVRLMIQLAAAGDN